MKKMLLTPLALGISGMMLAQSVGVPSGVTPLKLNAAVKNRAYFYKFDQLPGADLPSFNSMVQSANKQEPKGGMKSVTKTVIGQTGYQLQTNAAICNRVVLSPDGSISATWTYSSVNDAAWADRGTGYNYFNGTSWGPAPTARIENTRTGFTNIGITNTGAEVVVTHEASDIHVSSRAVKGTGAWSDQALGYPDVWSRMAVGGSNGHTLHVISQTKGTGNPPYHGQDGALAYSRSLDGGTTWDLLRSIIPPLDSSHYAHFGGDSYSIDAKGDTIAIVVGGFDIDVVLVKSIDNGNTWTSHVVNAFPIPMFNEATMLSDVDGDGVADTIPTNDAAVHVMLDNNGMAHVWYGAMRMLNDNLTDGGVSYFPGTDGLMYWNENMGAAAPVMIASAQDIDGDGTLNVTDWGTYQTSLTSHPSAGIDASGKIYLAYSSIYEGNADQGTPGAGKSYRHTYIMRSDDGGATWCNPQDVTDPPGPTQEDFVEGVYGAVARHVDGFVHLLIQKDGVPGHGVGATTADPQTEIADMVYIKVPVADVACGAGVNDHDAFSLSTSIYPNPANETATLSMTAFHKETVTVNVVDVLGKLVQSYTNECNQAGVYNLELNLANYNKGIYFVNVIADGKSVTQKLIVE